MEFVSLRAARFMPAANSVTQQLAAVHFSHLCPPPGEHMTSNAFRSSKGLRRWLILLSIAVIVRPGPDVWLGCQPDTMYDVIPSADPPERQDAIECIVFW
jgi:hypothetical protein